MTSAESPLSSVPTLRPYQAYLYYALIKRTYITPLSSVPILRPYQAYLYYALIKRTYITPLSSVPILRPYQAYLYYASHNESQSLCASGALQQETLLLIIKGNRMTLLYKYIYI